MNNLGSTATMISSWVFLLLILSLPNPGLSLSRVDYLARRKAVFDEEFSTRIGAKLKLNAAEASVNKILMDAKRSEIAQGLADGKFPPSRHFFLARDDIEKSAVFKIIKIMPKGAILHAHDLSMLDFHELIKLATYSPDVYMCFTNDGTLQFKYMNKLPAKPECSWRNVMKARDEAASPEAFDNMLYKKMSLETPNPQKLYPTINAVWKRFFNVFLSIGGLVHYKPLTAKFLEAAFKSAVEDNVQYMEARSLLTKTYNIDGSLNSREESLDILRLATQEFVKDYPNDFAGFKVIGSAIRAQNASLIGDRVKEAIQFRQKYPSFYAGFDLVGQEDPGHSLLYFLDDLLLPSQMNPPVDLPYFYHAGETNWNGEDVDDNMVDAVLLNTSRVGHGFAILKHPFVEKSIREKPIAVELNPVSNQVLKLVDDLRNHPASALFSTDYPVVVSSDDPAIWGALPLSHDFYMAFMGFASAEDDLRLLKQLAINSIKYSAMSDEEKVNAFRLWQTKWSQFIDKVLAENRFNQQIN
ncbi:adenosine deaminase AGSA-like [Tubulanus polymorphus]|uniref:adenosine deaminase AGSA-like n=1 Tax=Tubulanus polymorphus TaxID=672921 RepID=UPI003DA652C0